MWLHAQDGVAAIASRVASGVTPPRVCPDALSALETRGLDTWIPTPTGFPPVLLVRGRPPARAGVAVVGSRATDPYGLSCARRVAEDAVRYGRSVISGGAEGCDAAAHRSALAHGGHTTVVLGAGHDHPYPRHHQALFEEIVHHGGCVISPFWPTTPPARYRFLLRNRVIAALAKVTVVVRAGVRSGALSTARAARDLGRTVLAVPGDVGEALSQGPHALLNQGALALTGPSQLGRVLDQQGPWAWPVRHRGNGAPWPDERRVSVDAGGDLSAPARRVLALAYPNVLLDLDELVMQTGLTVEEVLSATLELELAGLLEHHPGQRVCVTGGP